MSDENKLDNTVHLEDLDCGVIEFFAELGIITDEDATHFVNSLIQCGFMSADSLFISIEDALDEEAEEGESELLESLRDFSNDYM